MFGSVMSVLAVIRSDTGPIVSSRGVTTAVAEGRMRYGGHPADDDGQGEHGQPDEDRRAPEAAAFAAGRWTGARRSRRADDRPGPVGRWAARPPPPPTGAGHHRGSWHGRRGRRRTAVARDGARCRPDRRGPRPPGAAGPGRGDHARSPHAAAPAPGRSGSGSGPVTIVAERSSGRSAMAPSVPSDDSYSATVAKTGSPAEAASARVAASPAMIDRRFSWVIASRASSRKLMRDVATREPYGRTTATRRPSTVRMRAAADVISSSVSM